MYAPYEEQEIQELKAAIQRVRELHKRTYEYCANCLDPQGFGVPYPCPTIRALDGEQ